MTIIVEVAALLIAAVGVVSLIARLPPPAASGRRWLRRRRVALPPSADLALVEQLVSIAQSSAGDVHVRLRPVLRQLAAGKLAARSILLDHDDGAARAALGDELWELVRLERPAPAQPRGPGLALSRLTAFVTTLENL